MQQRFITTMYLDIGVDIAQVLSRMYLFFFRFFGAISFQGNCIFYDTAKVILDILLKNRVSICFRDVHTFVHPTIKPLRYICIYITLWGISATDEIKT